MRALIAVLLLLAATVALAKPPAGVVIDPEIAAWYHSLVSPSGLLCCDISDCREVKTRQGPKGWEVFIDRKSYGDGAPDAWEPVPPDVILQHSPNPTGSAVACWYGGAVRCFVPPAEV